MFCEGTKDSLDFSVFQACYPNSTIIPMNSCESVIHAVSTLKNNPKLAHIECVGLIDKDDRNQQEIHSLSEKNVYVLPVAEIENLFLLPDVIKSIAICDGYTDANLNKKVEDSISETINYIDNEVRIENAVVNFCRRRIDRESKLIDLSSSKTLNNLKRVFDEKIKKINIDQLASARKNEFENALTECDIFALLQLYDDKELLNHVFKKVFKWNINQFADWIKTCIRK